MLLLPIAFQYPVHDRRYDFDKEELTQLELVGRLVEKVNEIVKILNGQGDLLLDYEKSKTITDNRKLSPLGNFTGTIEGRNAKTLLVGVDDSGEKIRYLLDQFTDGQTGLVVDGGFFEDTGIRRNYDGGVF